MDVNPDLNQKLNENELASEITLRPLHFKDFIGQKKIIDNLKIFIKAAKSRQEALDHTIFYGPPGLGKTTLAQIIANEMGFGFKTTSGPTLSKAGDLAAILTNLKKGDILFIDEIHRLNVAVEELLYSAMEDFKLDIIIGEGPAARIIKIDLPKFTLIGATTRLGLISSPLRDRFNIPFRLDFYTDDELVEIVKRDAKLLNIGISRCGALEIAYRSRYTPRIAIRFLKRLRDFAFEENVNDIDKDLASNSLNKLGVDSYGLDNLDIKYLKFIRNHYNGGPVGIDTISFGISEEKTSVEDIIESYLIKKGFIKKTLKGRVLTDVAIKYLS